MSNYAVEDLVLYRHFMLIDSPIPFDLIANPTNLSRDAQGVINNPDKSLVTGRDICSRPAGAWRVDCWKLLPEQYHRSNPVFTMVIKYDADLLAEGEKVDIRYSDIDIGEGVAGVNGQLVDIPSSAFRPIVLALGDISDKIDSIVTTIQNIKSLRYFGVDTEYGLSIPDIVSHSEELRNGIFSGVLIMEYADGQFIYDGDIAVSCVHDPDIGVNVPLCYIPVKGKYSFDSQHSALNDTVSFFALDMSVPDDRPNLRIIGNNYRAPVYVGRGYAVFQRGVYKCV